MPQFGVSRNNISNTKEFAQHPTRVRVKAHRRLRVVVDLECVEEVEEDGGK